MMRTGLGLFCFLATYWLVFPTLARAMLPPAGETAAL